MRSTRRFKTREYSHGKDKTHPLLSGNFVTANDATQGMLGFLLQPHVLYKEIQTRQTGLQRKLLRL